MTSLKMEEGSVHSQRKLISWKKQTKKQKPTSINLFRIMEFSKNKQTKQTFRENLKEERICCIVVRVAFSIAHLSPPTYQIGCSHKMVTHTCGRFLMPERAIWPYLQSTVAVFLSSLLDWHKSLPLLQYLKYFQGWGDFLGGFLSDTHTGKSTGCRRQGQGIIIRTRTDSVPREELGMQVWGKDM